MRSWLAGLLAVEADGVCGVEELWVRAGWLGGEGVASSKSRKCKDSLIWWGCIQEMDLLALARTRGAAICISRLGAKNVNHNGIQPSELVQEVDLLVLTRTRGSETCSILLFRVGCWVIIQVGKVGGQ